MEKRKSLMKIVLWFVACCTKGVGLAALPDYIAHNINGITKVLPDETEPTETHFVYPASLKKNARLVAFEILFSKVSEWKF